MILFPVCRKNLISSLRGEYIDFIISRFTFTLFTMATALVLFRLNGGEVSRRFLQSTGMDDYLGFMVVGTALYGSTHGILLNVRRTLMTERRDGTLEAVLIIPFPRWQYYGGGQLHQLMLTGTDILLAVVLGRVLGLRFHLSVPGLLLGALHFFITLYGLALLVSLLMIRLKDTFFIQNTVIPVVLLIGGYLFPVDFLPPPLSWLASIVPVNVGVNLLRRAVLAGEPAGAFGPWLQSLLPGLAFLALGFLLLPRIERIALEEYLS